MKIISHGQTRWTFGLLVMDVRIILLLRTQVFLKINVLNGKKTDALLCNILRQSIDAKTLSNIGAYKTCYTLWNQVKKLYTNDIQRPYRVISSIANLKQLGMDISSYGGRMSTLKYELISILPKSTNTETSLSKMDRVFMIILLLNLGPDFKNIREQILTGAVIPNFDEALARLLRHTSTATQSMQSKITPDTSVMVSQSHSRSDSRGGRGSNQGRGQRPQCTYCHRLEHTHDRCYQLHSRPSRTAHLAQSSDHLACSSSVSGSSSTPQGVILKPGEYEEYLRLTQAAKSSSVFYHHSSTRQCIYLIVYIDDIVITSSDQDGIQKLKQHFFSHFQTKDLGKLKYFLGIEVAQSNSEVVISQRKYTLDILTDTSMLDCKPVDNPMDPNVKLEPGQGELLRDLGRY